MTLHAGLSTKFDLSRVLDFSAAACEAAVVPDVFVGSITWRVAHLAVESIERSTFFNVDGGHREERRKYNVFKAAFHALVVVLRASAVGAVEVAAFHLLVLVFAKPLTWLLAVCTRRNERRVLLGEDRYCEWSVRESAEDQPSYEREVETSVQVSRHLDEVLGSFLACLGARVVFVSYSWTVRV